MLARSKFFRIRKLNVVSTSARFMCSMDKKPNDERNNAHSNHNDPFWLTVFNSAISANPNISAVVFLSLRMATWYSMVFVFTAMKQTMFGPEWAVAFLIVKVTGKFRQPLNVLIAPFISAEFPLLRRVNSAALLGIMKTTRSDSSQSVVESKETTKPDYAPISKNEYAPLNARICPPATSDDSRSTTTTTPIVGDSDGGSEAINKLESWVVGPLNKYGFSYFLAAKLTTVGLLTGMAYAVRAGIDVNAILTDWGVSETVQEGGGSMAAATLLNTCLLPFHLAAVSVVAPIAGERLKKLKDDIEDNTKK